MTTPRMQTLHDSAIPGKISSLAPESVHILADLAFFRWYRDRVLKIVQRSKVGSRRIDSIEEIHCNADPEFRQQTPNGSVVASIDDLMDAAKRMSTAFKAMLGCALTTLGFDASAVTVRIKDANSSCAKAERAYTDKSPGPALAWVHDVVAGRVWLESDDKICEFVDFLKEQYGFSFISLKNRFAKPTASGFQDLVLLLRMQHGGGGGSSGGKAPPVGGGINSTASTQARAYFVCELQVTLQSLHDLNSKLHCGGLHASFAQFLDDELAGSVAKKLQLIDTVVDRVFDSERKSSLDEACASVVEGIRSGADADFIAGLATILESVGDFESSVVLRERHATLGAGGGTAKSLYAIGVALSETSRFHRAARLLKKAADLESTGGLEHAKTLGALGIALAFAGHLIAAYDVLQKASEALLKRNALFGQVLHNMGLVKGRQGDHQHAAELYKQAAKVRADALGTDSLAVGCTMYNLANSLALAGKPEEALIKYEEALACLREKNKYYEDCTYNYAKLLVDLGDEGNTHKARLVYEKAFPNSGFFNGDGSLEMIPASQEDESDDDDSSEEEEPSKGPLVKHTADASGTAECGREAEDVYATITAAREKEQEAVFADCLRKSDMFPDVACIGMSSRTKVVRSAVAESTSTARARQTSVFGSCAVFDPKRNLLRSIAADEHRTTRTFEDDNMTSRLLVRRSTQGGATTPQQDQNSNVGDLARFFGDQSQTGAYEIVEGGASACSALAAPDMGQVDAFPGGSFVMYEGAYLGVVEDILGSGQFGMVHRFFDVTHHPPQRVAMKSLATGNNRYPVDRLHCMLCEEAATNFHIGTHPNLVSMRRVLVPTPGTVSNFPHVLILSDLVEGKTLGDWMGSSRIYDSAQSPGLVVPDLLFEGQLYSVSGAAGSTSMSSAITSKRSASAAIPSSSQRDTGSSQFAVVEKRLAGLTAQLYLAIHHMHSRGVMHQDIKPDNCMVTPSWWLRVTDYGLAGHSHTAAYPNPDDIDGRLCAELKGGSPAYMSPEALTLMKTSTRRGSSISHRRRSSTTNSSLAPKPDGLVGRDNNVLFQGMLGDRGLASIHRTKKRQRQITPATSDLWAAAVIVVEIYARHSFVRKQKSAAPVCGGRFKKHAALVEFERYRSSPNASHWGAKEVRAWLCQPRHSTLLRDAAKLLKRTTGPQLASMSEKRMEQLLEKAAAPARSRRLLLRLRATELQWYAMPPKLATLVESSLAVETLDRPKTSAVALEELGCETLFGELKSTSRMVGFDCIPDEAKAAVPPHTAEDVRGTLGSIGSLFATQHKWASALEAYAAWLGESRDCSQSGSSHSNLRREALAKYCEVLRSAPPGSIRRLDFSRKVKEHWRPIDDCAFDTICTTASYSHGDQHGDGSGKGIEEADFYGQHCIRCGLAPLAGLLALRVLTLTYCRELTGDLAPLASLVHLERVELMGCGSLEGPLDPLATCTKMTHLTVAHCPHISGNLAPMKTMRKLEYLNLMSNNRMQLSGTLDPIAQLTRLSSLRLNECRKLSGRLEALKTLTSLTNLEISSTEFDEPEFSIALSELPRLRFLDVSGCDQRIQVDLTFARSMPDLEVLDASNCGKLTGNLNDLKNSTALTSLSLSHCVEVVGDLESLGSLRNLELLDLDACAGITGTLEPLSKLTRLEVLKLSGSRCTGTLAPLSKLTSLQCLDLELCECLEGTLDGLSGCVHLEELIVVCHDPFTQFEGTLEPFRFLTRLRKLQITNCREIQGTLEPLSRLTNLTILQLENCTGLTGTIHSLSSCTKLRELGLAYCHGLTGSLESLSPLRYLPLIDLNLFMCKSLTNIDEFHQYKRANPDDNVRAYYKNRKKRSDAHAAKSKKFLGY